MILLLPGICIEIEFDLIAENRNMNSNLIDCLLASFKLKDYQKNYGKVTQMQFNYIGQCNLTLTRLPDQALQETFL